MGGLGSRALNLLLPGLGVAANVAGNAYYGAGPLGGLRNQFAGPGNVQRQGIDAPGVQVPDATGAIGLGHLGMPATGGFMPSPYGPYAGGYQFQNPMAPSNINPISGLPNTQTSYGVSLPNYGGMPQTRNLGFGGGNYMTPGQIAGAGTYINDPWGETAAGFGVGAAGTPSIRQTGGDWAGHAYTK